MANQQDKKVNGSIAVINGQVKVTAPQPGGQEAILIPTDQFVVIINGRKIYDPTNVTATDEIEVKSVVEAGIKEFTIKLSQDKMIAEGILTITSGKRYKLVDLDPAFRLTLEGLLIEEPPEKLPEEELKAKLAEAKVVYGIDQTAIAELLKAQESVTVILARGVTGKPPIDETIEYLFEKKEKVIDAQDKIDYREKNNIISVKKGDILAVKTPAQLGEKGIDVTGQVWEPPFPKIINIQAGPGTAEIENGMKLVATQDGQPAVRAGKLTVKPVYEIKAVTLDSGNIHFDGSVIVFTNVEENMLVNAKENVEVYGNVVAAQVRAGGDIVISKNAVASKVQAGGEAAVSQTLLKFLLPIPPILTQIDAKSKAAREAIVKKGITGNVSDGYLIKLMLENMFPQLIKLVKELVAYTEKRELDADEQDLVLRLKKSFLGLGPTQLNFVQLRSMKASFFQVISSLQHKADVKAQIKVNYIQNTLLEASGDIIIAGKGGFNSEISAGGAVRFIGRPGVFRGGNILAGGDVEAGELGSPTEVITTVTVPKHAKIKARLVYPNVIIKVGSFSEKIQHEVTNYEAWVSDRGLETVKMKN